MVKVLFVCMGNICRSPTAEGVFTQMVKQARLSEQIYIDSAGTHDYNLGKPPDSRSQAAARRRGIDLSGLRARQVIQADLIEFDYVLAMDKYNYQILLAINPPEHKLHLFLDFAPELNTREVPDPYEGGNCGFEHVLDLVQAASRGLLAEIRQRLNDEIGR
ncbi:MAG TPA: low molecular weight phosphotyrosine protein phosphatase [Thioploca sp.]|nr:MAG: phosphotyrosine protein phosphatase [Beggiatoa sp. 4572_84]RKZ59854.1 MAG: low molecular weight phosphotyrosine protein phosphatase [Gammaproteobacteria bacterium]HDN27301.1 low molecular weight phosphotyrosine protein phosphatase [Thioploca sp.]